MPDRQLPATLSPEESRIHAHLEAHALELVAPFLRQLEAARLGITQRLFQAIVREELVSPDRVANAPGWVRLQLEGGVVVAAAVSRRLTLGRFDLAGPPRLEDPHGARPLTRPDALWLAVAQAMPTLGLDAEATTRFAAELDNSSANYALALAGAERRRNALKAAHPEAATALELVGTLAATEPDFSPLAFFESWVVDGHPLHPGAKLKLGMTPDEVIAHSPEWGAEPAVGLVAVARSACKVHTQAGQGPKDLLGRDHPAVVEAARRALEARGARLDDYELLPLHPWQLERTLGAMAGPALEDGRIVKVPGVTIPTRALMSVRSLAPKAGGHHLKTAINVQTTGAVRTVSPQSAENGPRLSALLAEITVLESGFGGGLVVLQERCGIHAHFPELDEAERHRVGRNLAALVRENPEDHVAPGEWPMPGAALLARSPVGDGPIVTELISRFAAAHGEMRQGEAAVAWVRRYAEVALPGFLTLLSRWGVALEAHLQNCVPVFGPDGGLQRMLVRDFGGVRVLDQRLARHGLSSGFAPGSATRALDERDLRNKLFYPLVQNHLGELIAAIARALDVPEAPMWHAVAGAAKAVCETLEADAPIADQARADAEALFAPTLELKAMATMRLVGEVTRYTFAAVANPLALEADRQGAVA